MHRVRKYKLDHLAFWTITLLFYAFTRKDLVNSDGWGIFTVDIVIRNLLIAGACYFNIYVLFENIFRKKHYFFYGVSLILLLLIYALLQIKVNGLLGTAPQLLSHIYYHFSIAFFYIGFTLALHLSKQWYSQQLLLHKLESERLSAELQYLKAQLNPHFLFNSLNTIYFQIEPSNSEARESLQKFAGLLRYQLYDCNDEEINIDKEVDYLESYVDLQRLRKNSNYRIELDKKNFSGGFRIAPLLLLPFVENAFKHLSGRDAENNFVHIELQRSNGSFIFSSANSIDTGSRDNPNGIGLKNVKRRLTLLYPDRHKLQVERTDGEFKVKLELLL